MRSSVRGPGCAPWCCRGSGHLTSMQRALLEGGSLLWKEQGSACPCHSGSSNLGCGRCEWPVLCLSPRRPGAPDGPEAGGKSPPGPHALRWWPSLVPGGGTGAEGQGPRGQASFSPTCWMNIILVLLFLKAMGSQVPGAGWQWPWGVQFSQFLSCPGDYLLAPRACVRGYKVATEV